MRSSRFFEQTPSKHTSINNNSGRPSGCSKCAINHVTNCRKSNTKEFIEKAKKIFEDQYDYSEVDYINSYSKVKIGCKIHGFFEIIPKNHLSKQGCRLCRYINQKNKRTMSLTEFINRSTNLFGNRYDYTKVIYINSQSKVIIICKDHGEYLITPSQHLCNVGCKLCGIKTVSLKKTYTTQEFIDRSKEIHKNAKYDYTQTVYIKSDIRVKINCEEHGIYDILPSSHIQRKQGCPKCVFKKNIQNLLLNG